MRKKNLALFLPLLVLLGFLHPRPAVGSSFCGGLDFRRLSNQDLEQILLVENLSRGITPKKCGLVGESFAICSACSNEVSEQSMQILRPMLGSKAHSEWHAKWHKVRSQADNIPEVLFEKIKADGLVPSDARRNEFLAQYKQNGTLAGENFFYMHRMMIKMVQVELSANGMPCIEPWRTLPATIDDRHWPVPRQYDTTSERQRDEKTLRSLKGKMIKYQDSKFLRKLSLNKLGLMLELELHQNLHEFYRSTLFNSPEALAQGYKDDLLPVETSPANKYFWKIHGLVDEILGNWLVANDFRKIDLKCDGSADCYQWKATWVGKYPKIK